VRRVLCNGTAPPQGRSNEPVSLLQGDCRESPLPFPRGEATEQAKMVSFEDLITQQAPAWRISSGMSSPGLVPSMSCVSAEAAEFDVGMVCLG
jgi:hypothetical protein